LGDNKQLAQEPAGRIDEFLTHPQFQVAAARAAMGLVEMYRGNRILNRILNDRGRLAFGMLAMYLDATPDENGVGLTVTRIANLCQETDVCSRGRAKALVMLMRWAGYLEPAGAEVTNGRVRPLVPTPLLLEQQRLRWENLYGGLALIDPCGTEVVKHLDDPIFLRLLARELGARYIAGFRVIHYAPEMNVFMDRDCGLLVALSLLISGEDDDVFPPVRPVPISIAALATQIHVSRAHVLKLMREAEHAGLLDRISSAQGSVRLLPKLNRCMSRFFAVSFSALEHAGRSALEDYKRVIDDRMPPVPEADHRIAV
jgi:hypothetical protein